MATVPNSSAYAALRKLNTSQANENESHMIAGDTGASHQVHFTMTGEGCFNPKRLASGEKCLALRQRNAAGVKDSEFTMTFRQC